jgi:hypothetical protein
MRRLLAATLLVLAAPASAQAARVPDLTGMTVGRAAKALERAELRPEAGERLELRRRDTRRPEFVKHRPGQVTSQSLAPGTAVQAGTIVAVATAGKPADDLALAPHAWSRIAFAHGRIVLRGLEKIGDCVNYDHATLGPPVDGAREITVWARDHGVRRHGCERRPSAFVLHPGRGWTVDTLGVPRPPSTPDPSKTNEQAIARVHGMLEPDRQTVYAAFTRGGCHQAAEASATLQGTTAVLRVVLGADPSFDDVCDSIAIFDAVLIRLPAPAPPGTELVSAPCREPDQPGLPEELPCYS